MFRILFILGFMVLQGCSTIAPRILQGLDRSVSQAIVVHPVKQGSQQATLSAWQRYGGGWRRLYLASAVIGRNGLAAAGRKREGDGKTPSGIYPLGPAFGYAPSIHTGLAYRQATENDFWVDDTSSIQYNQWVHGQPQANSFERMRRPDGLYQYGIVIGYNMPRYNSDGAPQKAGHPIVPGAGSAIFMHVWRRYNSPTAGCVALNIRHLRQILRWLNQENQPVIILE